MGSWALREKGTQNAMRSFLKSGREGDEGQGGGGCTVARADWSCFLVVDVDGTCCMPLATSLLDGVCILWERIVMRAQLKPTGEWEP